MRRKQRRREYINTATTPTIAERDALIEEHEEATAAAGIPPEQAILDSADEAGSNDDDYDENNEDDYSDDSEEDERNLTRQLAETAVSVREMSRELGRARVKSSIQSVLIVTKARDNQLIRLTRELALYLMKTPRHGRSRGITVYVDAQLRKSKRFDAVGIERENPEWFRSEGRHHHHHSHTGAGGSHQRRNSRKSSTSASSLNILGMAGASSDRLSASVASSGASTPALVNAHSGALSNGKPLTRLTEALVSRQLDRQLEKEKARRSGTSLNQQAYKDLEGQSGANTPLSPASAANGEEQGLLRYWTAEMCSKSPHLFDLVVTVSEHFLVPSKPWNGAVY
jgi:NAD+ kinase